MEIVIYYENIFHDEFMSLNLVLSINVKLYKLVKIQKKKGKTKIDLHLPSHAVPSKTVPSMESKNQT